MFPFVLVSLFWLYAFLSGIAHMAWRAAARRELRGIGIKPRSWWSNETLQTLTMLRDNRARLPGRGEELIRRGTFLYWNRIALALAILSVVAVAVVRAKMVSGP